MVSAMRLVPRLKANPVNYAGCYSLDLYCKYESAQHRHGEFPHSYTSESGEGARAQARRVGWLIHRDRTATCPKCAAQLGNGDGA